MIQDTNRNFILRTIQSTTRRRDTSFVVRVACSGNNIVCYTFFQLGTSRSPAAKPKIVGIWKSVLDTDLVLSTKEIFFSFSFYVWYICNSLLTQNFIQCFSNIHTFKMAAPISCRGEVGWYRFNISLDHGSQALFIFSPGWVNTINTTFGWR